MTGKKENLGEEITRPPVVVVLGHVDHGKCVIGSTLIPLTNGRIFSIEEIWEKYAQDKRQVSCQDKKGWISKPSQKIEVSSFNGEKVVKTRIEYLWKLRAPESLIKVKLTSGDEITVTPEHPFFVFTPSAEIQEKVADSLEKDDFVVVPQKLNSRVEENEIKENEIKENIIQRLSSLRNLIVFLDCQKATPFLEKLQKVNKQELYREGLFSTAPAQVITKRRIRVRDFVKIGKYFEFSASELYDMIYSFKNATEKWRAGKTSNKIKLPEIPKDFEKLGYIIGCLAGDGQTAHGILYNSNPEIQEYFRRCIKEVFDLETKLIKRKTGYKIGNTGWKTLTRFLTDIMDFPRWGKSKKINFPQFFNNPSFSKGFIAGLFDTDGYVSPFNYWAELTSKSKDLIKEISIILLQFGIHSSIRKLNKKGPNFKRKRIYWNLRIANFPYLKKFSNYFPIKHQEKKKRLREAVAKASTSRVFDLTPISGENLYSFYINEHLFPYFSQYRKYKNLSRNFLEKLLDWEDKISLPEIFLKSPLKNLINPGEISCIKVKEVKVVKNKSKFVYDLTVPKFHNFVAERIFVHNTAILDFIRKTNVAEKESGGITQHIGAYEIEKSGKKITFIDTPGHEAFSAMRARGAKVADIVILVVAADEGVKTQTKEAINLVKKSGIPMIVAINKIDKSQSQPEKVKRELGENEVSVESLGGKIPSIELSAKTGQNIEGLLDLILLVAEMENLKADVSQPAQGIIIETFLDEKKGPIATLILENGTLKEGQIIGTSSTWGKIKNLKDFQDSPVEIAYPSQPVTVLGFEKTPRVGEKIKVYKDSYQALGAIKEEDKKVSSVLFVEEGKKVLNIILKADVLGSLEAVEDVLKNLPQEKVILRILKSKVGNIQETDIKLAESSKAQIFGFRVRVDPLALNVLRQKKIKVKVFEIIYELVQGVREAMEKILEPEILRKDLGEIEILALFSKRKNRQTIGGRVTEGAMEKGKKCEILREEKVIGKGKIINLQQNRKDTERVNKGNECGILFESEIKIEEGDILKIYEEERKKGEL